MPGYLAVAYMSFGRWVALCPRPGCLNGEAFGRCDDGTVGGLEAARFTCRREYGGCGLQCGVNWPPNIADLERVLLSRPAPSARNWHPGETVEDLVRENLTHGLVPTDILNGGPSRDLFEFRNGDLIAGQLEFNRPEEA